MGEGDSMKQEDFNEVAISVNGEVVAKSSGPSPALEMIAGLVDEMRRREENRPDERQVERAAPERHSFIVMNSKTDITCIKKGCGQSREAGNHYTAEDVEKILERRRAIMPGYDEALAEWLS